MDSLTAIAIVLFLAAFAMMTYLNYSVAFFVLDVAVPMAAKFATITTEKRDSANAGRSRQIESASSQLRVNICRAACQKPGPPKGLGFRV